MCFFLVFVFFFFSDGTIVRRHSGDEACVCVGRGIFFFFFHGNFLSLFRVKRATEWRES